MAAFALGVFAPASRQPVRKPAPSTAQRLALIDKLCKTLGSQYRGLKQYRDL
jgi:hypothetical protein